MEKKVKRVEQPTEDHRPARYAWPVWCQPWQCYVAVLADYAPEDNEFRAPRAGEDWVEPPCTARLNAKDEGAAARELAVRIKLDEWDVPVEIDERHVSVGVQDIRCGRSPAEVVACVRAVKRALRGSPFEGASIGDMVAAGSGEVMKHINVLSATVMLAIADICRGSRQYVDAWMGDEPADMRFWYQTAASQWLVFTPDETPVDAPEYPHEESIISMEGGDYTLFRIG